MMKFTEDDEGLFKEGFHSTLYEKLGAHLQADGCHFAVWAPNAVFVSVIGDFNSWNNKQHPLSKREDGSGIWEGVISSAQKGNKYKFFLRSPDGLEMDKGDPFAFYWEPPPHTASIVWDTHYSWSDASWTKKREQANSLHAPISIYECHLPSWRRLSKENNRSLTYAELALILPPYVKEMGFTHVEFLPIMEHPFYGSWGYQTTGYYAPSSRYGTPQEFMRLIETCHQAGLGVILDWVPAHFPSDAHGLAYYDGTHLYEYEDPKKAVHPDWNTFIFDYSRPQVKSFMLSNATFWFEKFHIDGLRVDAVASMLYLDYSRKPHEWEANIHGGRENLEAIEFLKTLNTTLYAQYPYGQTIAEESTNWPRVSAPVYKSGLGFGLKWNMGWMHDVLAYLSLDPIYRKYHHNQLLFSMHYAYSENFLLPLSHDEVVHGKGSLLSKMAGHSWEKFAHLRLLFGYMFAHPGKKLLFMGGEWGQWNEWNHDKELDWHLLSETPHQQIQHWVKDLNHLYCQQPALYACDFKPEGFEWLDMQNDEQSMISFLRKGDTEVETLLIIVNFTPMARLDYRVGVPYAGFWNVLLSSNSAKYGGSDLENSSTIASEAVSFQDKPYSLSLRVPPLTILFFKFQSHQTQFVTR